MNIIDITRAFSPDIVVYPGDLKPEWETVKNGQYRTTLLHMSSHSGTHIDAPLHYFEHAMSIDQIPLSLLVGDVWVQDLSSHRGEIQPEHLEGLPPGTGRLLIRTCFSGKDEFSPDYPYLTPESSRWLRDRGVRCVGVDSPSIEVFQGDGTVHRLLLESGIIIIELLDLAKVAEGRYLMAALPLPLKGVDGSPARVILIENGEEEFQ
ncbi:MAG: cyclase family protein [Methanomicrobiaceae archaeon]|nr:cyclase family protein [Methanomicrobiaceae archaeon]